MSSGDVQPKIISNDYPLFRIVLIMHSVLNQIAHLLLSLHFGAFEQFLLVEVARTSPERLYFSYGTLNRALPRLTPLRVTARRLTGQDCHSLQNLVRRPC